MRIDFHAHVLPHADHGSTSVESSIKQIEEAKKAEVDFIVATPHFYPNKHNLYSFLISYNSIHFTHYNYTLKHQKKKDILPKLLTQKEVNVKIKM